MMERKSKSVIEFYIILNSIHIDIENFTDNSFDIMYS